MPVHRAHNPPNGFKHLQHSDHLEPIFSTRFLPRLATLTQMFDKTLLTTRQLLGGPAGDRNQSPNQAPQPPNQ